MKHLLLVLSSLMATLMLAVPPSMASEPRTGKVWLPAPYLGVTESKLIVSQCKDLTLQGVDAYIFTVSDSPGTTFVVGAESDAMGGQLLNNLPVNVAFYDSKCYPKSTYLNRKTPFSDSIPRGASLVAISIVYGADATVSLSP